MLFGREYMPEGAGVDPDAPRKKGAARLWEILSRDLDGIFLSGVLAMLACAPAAILAGVALWLGSLPLCLLAAAAASRHRGRLPSQRATPARIAAGAQANIASTPDRKMPSKSRLRISQSRAAPFLRGASGSTPAPSGIYSRPNSIFVHLSMALL